MKLILREYLASLRERAELDVILPNLLSEMGYTVFVWPQVGTMQCGVDIAAVSPASAGPRRVHLLSVKRGDLTRTEWSNDTPQALRPSLVEILDGFIPHRIPKQYAHLPIVVCLCFGGEMADNASALVHGFIQTHEREGLTFEIWNGDFIANLLLDGILREDIFPKTMRSDLRKAIALLDEPTIAYGHYARLAGRLAEASAAGPAKAVTAARQLYIAAWMLYVWSRESGNLEAPYRASELGILHLWEFLKPHLGGAGKYKNALERVMVQMINLHLTIAEALLIQKIEPAARKRDAVAAAVGSPTSVDINLALFELVGRAAMTSLWMHWLGQHPDWSEGRDFSAAKQRYYDLAINLIRSNGCLGSPIADQQTVDVGLVFLAGLTSEQSLDDLVAWISVMVDRLTYAFRSRSHYPSASDDYRDWLTLPGHGDEEGFKDATVGSSLIPLLAAWASGLSLGPARARLAKLVEEVLPLTTMQMLVADEATEAHLYLNTDEHGWCLNDLPIVAEGTALVETIQEACESHESFKALSAWKTGFWPVILLACRHWRRPIPPDFYADNLAPPRVPTAT